MLWLLRLTLTLSGEGGNNLSSYRIFFNKEVFHHLKWVEYEVNNSFRATFKSLGEYDVLVCLKCLVK